MNKDSHLACCLRQDPSHKRNNGWFLRIPGSVSWTGSCAQFARDLCVGASYSILPFFILGGVALHERLVGEGLDALLPLRTAVLNGSYDSFWEQRSHVLV